MPEEIKILEEIVVDEKRLEQILYDNPHYLEEGMKAIARQFPTDSGPLDLLFVDEDDTLVVVELKNEEDDQQLLQALRYYDYITENLYEIAHHFNNMKIKVDTKGPPRLMLVAPSLSDTLKRAAKYLDIEISLKEYIAVKMSSGGIGLIIRDIELPSMQSDRHILIEEKLELIKDENLKNLAKSIIEQLKSEGVELRPIHGVWISLYYRNRKLASMGCRRTRIVIVVPTLEGESKDTIHKEEDWAKIYQEKLKPSMKKLESVLPSS